MKEVEIKSDILKAILNKYCRVLNKTLFQVYVLKRPHVDEFLQKMGELFECVLFTASLAKVGLVRPDSVTYHHCSPLTQYPVSSQYADPVADLLDQWGVFRTRLFRESCVFHRGNYVKDLSRLGRELGRVIIVDNSPASYIFHPENAVSRQTSSKVCMPVSPGKVRIWACFACRDVIMIIVITAHLQKIHPCICNAFLSSIINTISSKEYLKHSVLTLRVVPLVRFYKASLSKMALFISLMHPPHYLFTPSSSPIMKDFGVHRWLSFDHTLRTTPVPAGPGAVLVRRHDGHRAAGSDPPAGGPQQGGGCLQSAAESEEQVADPACSGSASRSCGPATVLQPAFVAKPRTQTPLGNTCRDVETINCMF